ncbi:hypothetical protein L798_05849 [Zootermopsis nevadensis]|uniref:Uncharacterized protein n=1 Tax=Zootermopsis nevadensis TaxID=136037 RepID=A0A067R8Q4_ZOONE|nr:hypothetical protein L798_05849 [Zootermopsis nevadensis]
MTLPYRHIYVKNLNMVMDKLYFAYCIVHDCNLETCKECRKSVALKTDAIFPPSPHFLTPQVSRLVVDHTLIFKQWDQSIASIHTGPHRQCPGGYSRCLFISHHREVHAL